MFGKIYSCLHCALKQVCQCALACCNFEMPVVMEHQTIPLHLPGMIKLIFLQALLGLFVGLSQNRKPYGNVIYSKESTHRHSKRIEKTHLLEGFPLWRHTHVAAFPVRLRPSPLRPQLCLVRLEGVRTAVATCLCQQKHDKRFRILTLVKFSSYKLSKVSLSLSLFIYIYIIISILYHVTQ